MAKAKYSNNAFTRELETNHVILIPYAEVTVYEAGTTDPIPDTIYADVDGVVELPNPFEADEYGYFAFFLDLPRRVKVVVTGTSLGTSIADYEPVIPDMDDLFVDDTAGHRLLDLEIVDPYSSWSTALTECHDAFRVQIGDYTQAEEARFADSAVMLQAVVGAVEVPSGVTSIAANAGAFAVAGYAKSASANIVAVYGTVGQQANGVGAWAMNTFSYDDGHSGGTLYGGEYDFRVDNAADTTELYGADYVGDGSGPGTDGSGNGFTGRVYANSAAVHVRRPNVDSAGAISPSGGVKWNSALDVTHGSSRYSLTMGVQHISSNGFGSIPIRHVSRTSGGVPREALYFVNANGEHILRPGVGSSSATTALRIQAPQLDQTAAGTDWAVITDSGIGINVVPTKKLDVYSAATGMQINGLFTNHSGNVGDGSVIGFGNDAGAEARTVRSGIGSERVASNGTADIHFLLNASGDISSFASHSIGRFANDSGFIVGPRSLASHGAGTLSTAAGVFVGAGTDSKSTLGVTINQAGNSDNILTFKKSASAHGMTDFIDTDGFGAIMAHHATEAGRLDRGFGENLVGMMLQGFSTNEDTSKGLTSRATVIIDAVRKNGTSAQGMGVTSDIFLVSNNSAAKLILQGDGTLFTDAAYTPSGWDDYNDVALLETFRVLTGNPDYRHTLNIDIAKHKQILHDTGVIVAEEDSIFMNHQAMFGLVIDAIRQLDYRMNHNNEYPNPSIQIDGTSYKIRDDIRVDE